MSKKYYKWLHGIYIILVASLAIGWYPESRTQNLVQLTKSMKKNVETVCLLDENNRLFLQGVAETDQTERKLREQTEERQRRVVKTIDKKKTKKVMAVGDNSRKILERIVEAEAGDQDMKGRMLVANVILNRMRSKHFPNTVKGVVFAPRQFSPVSNGSYYRVHVSGRTRQAVKKALQGEDASKGALYFMCRSASSARNISWFDRDLTRLFSHGCHEFFR
ncbi:MAG: cell wall hydrolase [Lachnospiraceae bacterium]|nr:cell wall hydrolase [Lachnospiraceae bacterium]